MGEDTECLHGHDSPHPNLASLPDGLRESPGWVTVGDPHCGTSCGQSREQARLGTCYREKSIFVMDPMMCEPLIGCVYE